LSSLPIHFSCIITCYNREKLISRSINSVLNQSFQNFEIIIVDDCSIDQSVAVVNSIVDPRIKIVKHDVNKGQNAALNTGINHSNYDYLAFLDSDDEWCSNYLMEMYNVYCTFPFISFAYSNFLNGPKLTLEGEKKYAETLNQGFLSSMITITAKKDAVEYIGKFDQKYTICQDDDFCFRLAKNFSFKVIDHQLAIIHGSENSMSNNLLDVAEGWAFLINNYKDDIIRYCGYKTLSKHFINISRQFFRCKNVKKGIYFYLFSLKYFFKKNNFKNFDYPLSEFLNMTCSIIKLNLGIIKRYLLKTHGRKSY